jgi:predicted  nucleic acid-binding Zn-ribbon protein
VVTAAAQDQWRLLDVQAHDTRLQQIAHRRRTLPQHMAIEGLTDRLAELDVAAVAARTSAGDVARELAKAEADVEQVRKRSARDRERLDAGQGSAKELQALQSELTSLAQRQSVLEDAELDVMERLEAAEARVVELGTEQHEVRERLTAIIAERDSLLARLDDEADRERRGRADASAGLPADLLALYERIRDAHNGLGAARMYQRRCEGCRLELTPGDVAAMRSAPDDAVLRCEECSRILVRTPDSGL